MIDWDCCKSSASPWNELAALNNFPDVGRTVDKLELAKLLHEIAIYLKLRGDEGYRARAYDRAGRAISTTTEDLAVLSATDRLTELPGIGDVIAQHIQEYVATGGMTYHRNLATQFPEGLLQLLRVPGLGTRKIHLLWKKLGIEDLDSLEAAARNQRIQKVRGLGKKTQEHILDGLTKLRAGAGAELAIKHARDIAQRLVDEVASNLGVTQTAIAGDIRRFHETISRIDLVAASDEPRFVLEAWERTPLATEVIDRNEQDVTVKLREADMPATLHVVPTRSFAPALHHHTGSEEYVAAVQEHAQTLGFQLDARSLRRGSETLSVHSEEALYALLKLPYLPPELREREVVARPQSWITYEQLQGVIHSHSLWSDGKASLEQMALAARDRGFTYLTVTDHSQSAFYAGGLNEDALYRQWDEIDELNERLQGIRLLKGSEVDLLEDGALDLPDRVLEKLEVVIGSIHVRHRQSEDEMTQRVLRALDNPYLDIWGHPTGRLIRHRDPVPLRMQEILEKAAEKGTILEVNGSPYRLDLSAEHIRMALKLGLKLVVSADSHSVRELDNLRDGATNARRGGATREVVLNTLGLEDFQRTLAQRRKKGDRLLFSQNPVEHPAH
jgi:DNA polymerase (family 10)